MNNYEKYQKKYYQKNADYYVAKAKERRAYLKGIIDSAKDLPCMDCGVRYPPYVMDLDHRDPSQKVGNVSSMLNLNSEKKIRDEIAKCDVVCANCHRIRTHGGSNPPGMGPVNSQDEGGLLRVG
jgi:lysyl-tRNA synthetase class I